jgi:hypothetical protein
MDHFERHPGLAAEMSSLCGGVCGVVQRRRHVSGERIHSPDIAAGYERYRVAIPDV